MPPSVASLAEQRQGGVGGQTQLLQYPQREPRGVTNAGAGGRRRGHPFRHVGQRAVRLFDHQHDDAAPAVTPDDADAFAAPGVERVVDRYVLTLVSGSMSLPRLVVARRTLLLHWA
jgi:hypothetical protein